MARVPTVVALLVAAACTRPAAAPRPTPAPKPAPAAAAPAAGPGRSTPAARPRDPAFPDEPKRGWPALDAAARARAAAFAGDYARFLGTAKTPRRAVSGLVALFSPGARELRGKLKAAPGTRFWLTGPGGQAAAFVRIGERPIEEGMRVLVAAVDAPRFDLKQQPFESRSGVALLDTVPYGNPEMAAWLAHPLALHVHASRPGAAAGDLELVIGEADADPVLTIPDLEPHLAGKVQARGQIVDSAERMDAVAARTQKALLDYLAAHGMSARELTAAEGMLVPAGPPVFVGVDRARLAGYGHASRALAYAAVRALIDARAGAHTAVVILVGKQHTGYSGAAGEAFVRQALSQVIGALAPDADLLASRRIHARSAVLVARAAGEPGEGVALSPHGDDALPVATRRVLDALAAAGAQVQVVAPAGWGGVARELANVDMDVVDLGLPVTGLHTPVEVITVFDLHHARLACEGWLQ